MGAVLVETQTTSSSTLDIFPNYDPSNWETKPVPELYISYYIQLLTVLTPNQIETYYLSKLEQKVLRLALRNSVKILKK